MAEIVMDSTIMRFSTEWMTRFRQIRSIPFLTAMAVATGMSQLAMAQQEFSPTFDLPDSLMSIPTAANQPRAQPPSDPDGATKQRYGRYVVQEASADNVLKLVMNRPRILTFTDAPIRTYIPESGDAIIAVRYIDPQSATQVAIEPRQLGSTVLTMWFRNPDLPGGEEILSWLVQVTEDPEVSRGYEVLLENIEREINRAFPDSVVSLRYVGRQVVVRGQARDIEEATSILRIVSTSLPRSNEADQPLKIGELDFFATSEERVVEAGSVVGALGGDVASGANTGRINNRIVNLLEIAGVHQVMLKVTVAEVNRTAARAIGADLSVNLGNAASFFTSLGAAGGGGSFVVNRGDFELAIDALKELNLARSLAEPTLMTLNGQRAVTQIGGSFPVSQITGFTDAGLQGVEFVPFGVNLQFLPIVTDYDRIRLQVNAAVSTRSQETVEVGGGQVPQNLNSRQVSTTVEIRDGETLAIAGLIQTNLGATSTRVPFLGDIPVIGRLFSRDSTDYGEQELIVLVTPYLVNPVPAGMPLALPGSDYFEPDDLEFFIHGSLTGHYAEDYRSPVRTDLQKMKAFRRLEQQMIIGQPGHSNGRMCPPSTLLNHR